MRLVVVVLLLAVAGCTTSSGPAAPPPTSPSPTALASIDTTKVGVARAAFCDRIPEAAVSEALGRAPADTRAWNNGDPLPFGVEGDIAHEFGCVFTAGKRSATAQVFAPPMTVARARALVRDSAGGKCQRWREAPRFGSPSGGTDCTLNVGTRFVALNGLFGDAWLTCGLTSERTGWSDKQLPARTTDWCAAVLAAART